MNTQTPNEILSYFPQPEIKNIHKVVILKFYIVYYRILGKNIEMLSFFSNRPSPYKKD